MSYLLDTVTISELRKSSRCDVNVRAWEISVIDQIKFLSVISMMEVKRGIFLAKSKNPEFSDILDRWYENNLKTTFQHRILPIDLLIAERCSFLFVKRTRGISDALIAATAYVHNLTLVTRNVEDFHDTEIKIINPWMYQADKS